MFSSVGRFENAAQPCRKPCDGQRLVEVDTAKTRPQAGPKDLTLIKRLLNTRFECKGNFMSRPAPFGLDRKQINGLVNE
jgi:hypothetical protein